MSQAIIRLASNLDIGAIELVDAALGMPPSKRPAVIQAIEEGRVVAASEGDSIVGYARWGWFWDRIPFSTFVRIHPDYQRRGLGKALYSAVEAHLCDLGERFWISSTEEDNFRSRQFHAALGFREIGALTELDQESPEVFLRKDL